MLRQQKDSNMEMQKKLQIEAIEDFQAKEKKKRQAKQAKRQKSNID